MPDCPDDDAFRRLLEGQMPSEQTGVLENHLRDCQNCRKRLNDLSEQTGSILVPTQRPNSTTTALLHGLIEQCKKFDIAQIGVPSSRTPTFAADDRPVRLGDYEVLSLIGRGGMGAVYRARQASLNREVALKVILGGQLASEAQVRRFRVEAEAAAKLDHPNIVPIFEIGQTEGHHFFSMRRIDGADLAHAIRQRRLSPSAGVQSIQSPAHCVTSARLVATVARAVHYAHQRGVLHRDLKPSNILLDLDFRPYVSDFGLAKILERGSELTRTDTVLGTPQYMAPEQAAGKSKEITLAVDIWSLGTILYELLAGRPPFEGDTALEILHKVIHTEPCALKSANAAVSKDLITICGKCLTKEPGRRYRSAEALAEDLERFIRSEPILSRPISQSERVWRWCRRKPALASALAGLMVAFLLGLTGILWQWRRAEDLAFGERMERQRAETLARAEASQRVRAERALQRTQIERAELLFGRGHVDLPLASLARLLRGDPTNHTLALRIASTLSHRNFCLPIARISYPSAVECAHLSADNRRLAVGLRDGSVRVCDAISGNEILPPLRQSGAVRQVEFSPDGRWLASVTWDGHLKLWDATNGTVHPSPRLVQDRGALGFAFSPKGDRLVIRSANQGAMIFDVQTGRPLGEPLPHFSPVVGASFSRDGQRIVTLGALGRVQVWDTESGKPLGLSTRIEEDRSDVAFTPDGKEVLIANRFFCDWSTGKLASRQLQFRGEDPPVACFSPDGNRLLTSIPPRDARLWELSSGRPVLRALQHNSQVAHLSFSPDGAKIVTCSRDTTARVWDASTGAPLAEPLRHGSGVRYAQFSADGWRLLTLTDNAGTNAAWIWDLRLLQPMSLSIHHSDPINSIEFSPDGRKLLTASADRTARIWAVESGQELARPMEHDDRVNEAAFSPNGRFVVTASYDGTSGLWDSSTGKSLVTWEPGDRILRAAFSPSGESVITASANGSADVWRADSRTPIATFRHKGPVLAARFSPDQTRVLTTSEDKTAQLWVLKTGQRAVPAFQHDRSVVNALFTADGRRVVTVSADMTSCVWDVETGRRLIPPLFHTEPLRHAAFHIDKDDHRVLTAAGKMAYVWDLATGAYLVPPLFHEGLIQTARFSPDGYLIVSGSDDTFCTFWDSGQGIVSCESLPHSAAVQCLNFSPDGRWLGTGSLDGTGRIWEIPHIPQPPARWLPELAEAVAGVRLNQQGQTEVIPSDELWNLRQRLLNLPRNDPWSDWIQWLFAESASRQISPHSPMNVPDLIANRIKRGTLKDLQAATLLSPTNLSARAKLSQALSAPGPPGSR